MSDTIELKDISGNTVIVKTEEIVSKAMLSDFRFLGIDGLAILEFRRQYLLKSGVLPITAGRIREIF